MKRFIAFMFITTLVMGHLVACKTQEVIKTGVSASPCTVYELAEINYRPDITGIMMKYGFHFIHAMPNVYCDRLENMQFISSSCNKEKLADMQAELNRTGYVRWVR